MPDVGDMNGEIGLPPLFPIRGFEGSTADYLNELYAQYQRVVGVAGVRLWDKPVVSAGRQGADGRDKRFWHIITDVSRDCGPRRGLILERCAWLPRCLSVLEAFAADEAHCVSWRGENKELHVVSLDFRVHAVLRETGATFMLVTAYPVDSADRAGRLMARAAAFWSSGRSVRTRRKTAPRLLESVVTA